MVLRRAAFSTALIAGSVLAGAAPAQAAVGFGLLPSALVGLPPVAPELPIAPTGCTAGLAPALGAVPGDPAPASSKASAILGGQMSALERIALEQAPALPAQLAESKPAALPGADLVPGAGPMPCLGAVSNLAAVSPKFAGIAPGPLRGTLGPDDYLASKRLPISRTSFDKAWDRVSSGGLSKRAAAQLSTTLAGQDSRSLMLAVNSWTNAKVRYVEDRELYGKADYWANAGTTLRRGAGDCEDIAIVKMQLLAALGVARSDMYLVIARDLARNADHAVLVVRREGHFWLLDNATSEVLEANTSFDYRPIMSFSGDHRWLHGY